MKIQKELWKNDKKDEVFMSDKKNLEKLNSQFFLVLENKNATDELKLKKINGGYNHAQNENKKCG